MICFGVRFGNKKSDRIKCGSGITKKAITGYAKQLDNFGGSVRQFCIQRGLDLEAFVQAMQRHESAKWESYVVTHSELAMRQCPQCSRPFIPMTPKQKTCSRRCTNLLRTDRQYFGGKRVNTIGLAEGICQLCDKEKPKLSAHHIFGKENDLENDFLVALCAGCHKLVTFLACRADVAKVAFLENLIILSLTRKFGDRRPIGFHVTVDVDELNQEDLDEDPLDIAKQEYVA